MDVVRRILLWLRKKYYKERSKWVIIFVSVLAVSTAAAFVVDYFVPMAAWWNLIRTAILIPLSASFFASVYFGVKFWEGSRSEDSVWIPLRERFSPRWRQRIAAVTAAVLLVLAYASTGKIGYTFISSVAFAGFFSLIVFIRKSSKEEALDKLGILDPRDLSDEAVVKRLKDKKDEEAIAKKENGAFGVRKRLRNISTPEK